LDWELSTLGHPLADLAYNCLAWRLPPELRGIAGMDVAGIPAEQDYVRAYCARTGRESVSDHEFFVAFSLFRWSAIAAGVYRRALDGNAADARARESGAKFRALAQIGWDVARHA
ncbi:MAG TPA: phosphotransferase family protein, partial [Acetobacteraceae bacterium]|nr:phosphotransferase family protein [Acetobacteraceae bacterium]